MCQNVIGCSWTSTTPPSQEDLFNLEKEDVNRVFVTLRRLKGLSWQELYRDRGLRWEMIQSRQGPGHGRLYSIRLGEKFRAVVCRDGDFLRFLSLHPDHDSAYS